MVVWDFFHQQYHIPKQFFASSFFVGKHARCTMIIQYYSYIISAWTNWIINCTSEKMSEFHWWNDKNQAVTRTETTDLNPTEWTWYVYTWNPNDPCFYWKRLCFGGLKPKNRGRTGSRYIYIIWLCNQPGVNIEYMKLEDPQNETICQTLGIQSPSENGNGT